MKPVSDFFSRLMPYVPGCPEPTAAQALVDAAIVFCEDSLVIRERLTAFPTVAAQASYTLTAPTNQQVARVMAVFVGDAQAAAWPAETTPPADGAKGQPTTYFTTRTSSDFKLHLYPAPDKAYQITVEAALRPLRGATQLEDDLLNLWADAVIAGALSRLMSVPGQPFTDLARAGVAQMTAAGLSRRARTEGNMGRVQGSMRVTQRPLT